MRPARARWFLPAACLMVVWALGAAHPPAAPEEDGLITRTFTIKFKPIQDVVLLMEPHIGDRGSYTVHPRLRAITVFDEPARIKRIGNLIADFDQPPRYVRLEIQLLNATEAQPASPRRSESGTGVPRVLNVTKWSEVAVIGSASIIAVEGAESSLNVGEEFRVRFSVETVASRQGVVKFDRFALDRILPGREGVRHVPIWDTVVNLRDKQQLLLGATSSQESRRAIFLSVTATIEPPALRSEEP